MTKLEYFIKKKVTYLDSDEYCSSVWMTQHRNIEHRHVVGMDLYKI